jgi:hypothetical protein
MPSFLLTSLFFFLIWIVLFVFSKDSRKEQIIMSSVGLLCSPAVLIIAASDYRNILFDQPFFIGIEDFIFAFSVFGVAAVVYHVLIGQHGHKIRGERLKSKNTTLHFVSHLVLVLGLWAFIGLLMIYVFNLASVSALIVGGLMVGIYIIADRHDLLFNALVSGVVMAALVFVLEQIFFIRLFPEAALGFWKAESISHFLLGGIPLEELMWAAVVGFTIGPMYEWLRKIEIKK